MTEGNQFHVVHLLGLICVVAVGLALLRAGLDGASAFILAGVILLLAAGGGIIGWIGHGPDGIVCGAVVYTFVGMLMWPHRRLGHCDSGDDDRWLIAANPPAASEPSTPQLRRH